MDTQMFCFQCEQTAGGKGCTKAGVCGKKSDIAGLQDQLTGALVGLARTTDGNTQPTENTYNLLYPNRHFSLREPIAGVLSNHALSRLFYEFSSSHCLVQSHITRIGSTVFLVEDEQRLTRL